MTSILTVAKKEFRGLFQSPVALIFLAVFELVVLFTFFSSSRWFARNLADVRPLFAWLPLLLVFLTAAVTMRLWAEERKVGTLEVLLTLPVPTRALVLGKFLAATGLVAVALGLTLPLPLMAAGLGPLDWGPVLGGYVGALLLGALYVAIGLCVSALTNNQVVSLMVTLVVGGAFYVVGTDPVTALFDTRTGELLRAIGTGSRFESLERGVLDLRDLVYYGVLTSTFLAFNLTFLELDRLDADAPRGKAAARALMTVSGLIAANALIANVWLAPVTALRVDLTENGDYSLSDATDGVLAALDEPIRISAYFSERTHPLLSPLVPQLRDLLEEYAVAGEGRVAVEFIDPSSDEDLQKELSEQFGVRSVPFQVDDAQSQAVINAFFHVLIRYGDQHQLLSFDQLVEVFADPSGPKVQLKNPEYELTRAIKKVSQDFSTLASVIADLPEPATLTFYVTPAALPADFQSLPKLVGDAANEIVKIAGDKVRYAEVDPGGDPAKQEELYTKYGLRPLAADLFQTQTFFADIVITMGDKVERLSPSGKVEPSDLKAAFEAALRRLAPGQRTTVGLLTEIPENPPSDPNIPPQFQPAQRRPDYNGLQQLLGDLYEVQPLQADASEVPSTVDVVVVGKPGTLSDHALFALDQYLMRGGKVIALASSHRIEVDREGISAVPQDARFLKLLEAWGVKVDGGFALDARNATFPRPVRRPGIPVPMIEMTPYPFFPDIRQDAMLRGEPAVAGLVNVTLPWGSALDVVAREGVTTKEILKTSANGWRYAGTDLSPTGPQGTQKADVVGVVATGTFPSFYAVNSESPPSDLGDVRPVTASIPDAQLAVLGSGEMVGDLVLQLAQQPGGEVHRGNLQLLQNLIDASAEDTDLLTIRSAGGFARTLDPTSEEERTTLTWFQIGLAGALLLGVSLVVRGQRGNTTSLFDTASTRRTA
jgi:ABC-2 type transport system permease protein